MTSPTPAGRRRVIFAVLAVALLMASVDQTIVATALPQVQRDLGAEANAAGWIITAYTLGLVLMLPVAGTLGDRYGRKSVFLVAAAVFTAASLACGLVHDLEVLVVLRFVQAIGGGALMPSATGIVVATFGEERDKALGAFSSVFPIGGIVGPLLGGVIVHWLSWRWIFLVNIPLGIGLIVAGAVFVPRIEERRDDDRFDLLGIAMLMGALLAFMMGVSLMSGVDDRPFGLAVLVLSACATCAFFRHTRLRSSFLPRELLVGSRFAVMNVINFLYGSVALGLGVLIPLYAHNRFGMGSLEGGSLMTLRAVGAVIAAIVAIVLLRRFGYRRPMMLGLSLMVMGMTAMALTPAGPHAYLGLAVAAVVTGLGTGATTPAANNATLQLAPEQAASIAGLRAMFRHCGAIVTVSVVTSVIAGTATPAAAHAVMILVVCGALASVVPFVWRAPDHRGAW